MPRVSCWYDLGDWELEYKRVRVRRRDVHGAVGPAGGDFGGKPGVYCDVGRGVGRGE